MSDNTFHSVWHRSGKKGLFELLAFNDSGTLVVRENQLEFIGKNRLVIGKILRLSYGKQGTFADAAGWVTEVSSGVPDAFMMQSGQRR